MALECRKLRQKSKYSQHVSMTPDAQISVEKTMPKGVADTTLSTMGEFTARMCVVKGRARKSLLKPGIKSPRRRAAMAPHVALLEFR